MTEPPPRKRIQIHLSTAVVMMFVAGGIIWANCIGRTRVVDNYTDPNARIYWLEHKDYGWPSSFRDEEDTKERKLSHRPVFDQLYTHIMLNLATASYLLFATWFLCEWLIRRRAARKGA